MVGTGMAVVQILGKWNDLSTLSWRLGQQRGAVPVGVRKKIHATLYRTLSSRDIGYHGWHIPFLMKALGPEFW